MKAVIQSMKFALKDIKGMKTIDDEGNEVEYKLSFDNNEISDDSIDDILNMPIAQKVSSLCTSLMSGLSSKITDLNGKEIEGLEFIGKVQPAKK